MEETPGKLRKLETLLAELGSAVVGFSGGVDSSFLAAAAQRVLAKKRWPSPAVRPPSRQANGKRRRPSPPSSASATSCCPERTRLRRLRAKRRRPLLPLQKGRFTALAAWASDEASPACSRGQRRRHRRLPAGLRALEELAAMRSPLLEAGLTKDEIRASPANGGCPPGTSPPPPASPRGSPTASRSRPSIWPRSSRLKPYCGNTYPGRSGSGTTATWPGSRPATGR